MPSDPRRQRLPVSQQKTQSSFQTTHVGTTSTQAHALPTHPHSHLFLAQPLLKCNNLRIVQTKISERRAPSARCEASDVSRGDHVYTNTLPSRVLLKTLKSHARFVKQMKKSKPTTKRCPQTSGTRDGGWEGNGTSHKVNRSTQPHTSNSSTSRLTGDNDCHVLPHRKLDEEKGGLHVLAPFGSPSQHAHRSPMLHTHTHFLRS